MGLFMESWSVHLVHDGLGVLAGEGDLPGLQLPQQHAEAVHVARCAGRTPAQKLWSLE